MTARKRRGPHGGYNNPSKNAWRQWVWDLMPRTGHTLIMPSREGCELDLALELAVPPSRLHVVDESPAIVAVLTRRHPGIQTKGARVDVACKRIAASGVRLTGANIDLCSSLAPSVERELARCWDTGVLDVATVFITVLRGREDKHTTRLRARPSAECKRFLRDTNPADWWTSPDGLSPTQGDFERLRTLHLTSGGQRDWSRAYAYRSTNGQTFLTAMFKAPPIGVRRAA